MRKLIQPFPCKCFLMYSQEPLYQVEGSFNLNLPFQWITWICLYAQKFTYLHTNNVSLYWSKYLANRMCYKYLKFFTTLQPASDIGGVHNLHTLQIFIVILLCKSIKIIGVIYNLMIENFFCKFHHWNPGIAKQLSKSSESKSQCWPELLSVCNRF